jgi:hypothetical protein
MRYIITESQLKFLVSEQVPDSHFGLERFGYNSDKPETLDKAVASQRELNSSQLYRTVMQVMTSFIPVIGPAISMGLVGFDIKRDYDEASTPEDKKRIILSYVIGMALVWGLGKVFKSISSLGESGMTNLSNKMRRNVNVWKNLSSQEMSVIFDITNGQQYWSDKLKNIK